MPGDPDWLEYAKLGVSALTPIMTGVIGIVLVRLGTRLDTSKQLQQELMRKRLQLFDDIAPQLNDVHCFFQAIGHWSDLAPDEIIKRKRRIDRCVQINRFLFSSAFWTAYQKFEAAHFDTFATVGQPARLRLDLKHMRERIGDYFKDEWMPFASSKPGDHEDQLQAYQTLMELLGREIRGD